MLASFSLITSLVASLGYPGVALLLVVSAPELVLPFAGFLVAQDKLGFGWVLVAGTLGALVGQVAVYALARAFGEPRVRRFLKRRGHLLLLRESDLDKVLHLFKRFDAATLVFARFIPTVRTLVSMPAGFVAMSLWRFAAFTALGTLLWNAALVGVGVLLGHNWRALLPFFSVYGWVVLGCLLTGAVWLLWRRQRFAESPA